MQNLPLSNNSREARYDTDAVRHILARATEIERSEPETFSATQVEALGKELGLSPDAVRRAIGEFATASHTAQPGTAHRRLLTRRDVQTLLLPGIGVGTVVAIVACSMALLVAVTGKLSHSAYTSLYFTTWGAMTYMAAIFTAVYGWRTRDFRLGVLMGTLAGTSSAAALGIARTIVQDPYLLEQYSILGYEVPLILVLLSSVVGAIAAGLVAGQVSYWWERLRQNEDR